jgi:hypothetical protein
MTPGGLDVRGDPPLEEFGEALERAQAMGNNVTWVIGDLIVYGESREWGEKYTQYLSLTQRSYRTLLAMARVAKEFPPGKRKFIGKLSWSHHYEVLPLPSRERGILLEDAVRLDWGRDDIREHVKHAMQLVRTNKRSDPLEIEPRTSLSRTDDPTPAAQALCCPQCGYQWSE